MYVAWTTHTLIIFTRRGNLILILQRTQNVEKRRKCKHRRSNICDRFARVCRVLCGKTKIIIIREQINTNV